MMFDQLNIIPCQLDHTPEEKYLKALGFKP
jgi:hypothetical protein